MDRFCSRLGSASGEIVIVLTSEEQDRITRWNDGLASDVVLQLITTEDPRSVELKNFCESLTKFAPRVRVIKDGGHTTELPALGIGPRLRYHAIPLGKELAPFLMALSLDLARLPRLTPPVQQAIEQIDLPAFLRLFVTQQCPFCPVTVQQLLPLPAASERIHLAIIDGALFPDVAQQHDVRSAPTLFLDEGFRWTGSVPLPELLKMMWNRDPANMGPESLASMLKEGHASRVAEMMLEKGAIFPAFFDLLAHEKMFIRLGAMVVMETMADQDTALAAQVVDPLWKRFLHATDQVQGDIVHVLGESGDKKVIPKLETILSGKFSREVKVAAREALERIKP